MKIDRIMGVVLSIIVLTFLAYNYVNNNNDNKNPFELIGDNGYIRENIVNYEDKVLSSNDSSTDIIEFTNTHNYPVEMNQDVITIKCTGTGSTKAEDEALVNNNFNILAKFSEEKDSNLYDSLFVPNGKKIYIHIINEYNGEMPNNPVNCDYSLSIQSS